MDPLQAEESKNPFYQQKIFRDEAEATVSVWSITLASIVASFV